PSECLAFQLFDRIKISLPPPLAAKNHHAVKRRLCKRSNEGPNRPVVHFEASAGKLCHNGAQGEAALRDALPKKGGMLTNKNARPMRGVGIIRCSPNRDCGVKRERAICADACSWGAPPEKKQSLTAGPFRPLRYHMEPEGW